VRNSVFGAAFAAAGADSTPRRAPRTKHASTRAEDEARLEKHASARVEGSIRRYIEGCLARWGLSDAFACLVAGDDDEPGEHKPSPAPYLHAAKRLGVAPEDCYAVEDSPSGIQSALAAGVAVVAVLNPANEGLDVLARCAAVVDDLSDTSLFV